MKVLIVDDDEDQLLLAQRMLSSQGCVVRVTDRVIGLADMVQEFEPDVVLLDVELPALSGDRLVTMLRKVSTCLLVLFSANDRDYLRRLSKEVGADAWIEKGLTAEELVARLRAIGGFEDI